MNKELNSVSEVPGYGAKERFVEERRTAEKACNEEIKAALEKYECKLDVEVVLKEGSITPRVTVVSK